MKKSLLMLIALGFVVFASAQVNKSGIPEKLLQVSAPHLNASTGNELLLPIIIQEQNPYFSNKGREDIFGIEIGRTWYDLQTNSGLPNRLIRDNNNNISAVWTMAGDALAGYPTRGSGFNYSTNNGNTWLANPTIRVENVRTGWPNIVTTNSNHVIIAHNADNLTVSTKPISGSTWSYNTIGTTNGYIWPRMVSNGNTIHVIGTTDTDIALNGFSHGSLTYWRSTDGGANWVDQDRILPNYDTAHFGLFPRFQDDYNMAIKGDTVAILVSNTHAGTFMWKSTNAGVGWTFIDILNPPCRKWNPEGGKIIDFNNDAQQDNIIGSDGSSCVVFDNNGMAHCFFGRMQESGDGSGGPSYYPYWDGIYYWNESMPAITWDYFWNSVPEYCAIPDTVAFPCIAYLYDLNGNGEIDFAPNPPSGDFPFGVYQTSLTSQINAAVDKNNNIHLAFSAVVENVYTNVNGVDRNYRNIFMLDHKAGDPNHLYPNGTSTWKPNPNYPDSGRVMLDDYTEEVYPIMVKQPIAYVGDSALVAFIYQADALPGNSLQPATPNHGIVENVIYIKRINVPFFPVGIDEKTANLVNAPKIYPNPATNNVSVFYNLSKASNVTLGIYNMVGQQIMTTSKYINAGEVNVTLNIETLPQGIYFIKSDIGNETYTNKLVVN